MKYSMYIGGYGTESISRVVLQDGRLRKLNSFAAVNASYLCASQDAKTLYAVGETQRFRGTPGGSVQSYRILENGKLEQTSMVPTHGADPCHLILAGNLLLTANYTSGSVSRFRLNDDGTVGDMLPVIQHSGHSLNPERQEGPHAHQVQITPDGYLAVSDLGLDAILFYPAIDVTAEQPEPIIVKTPAGFGPRHCIFPSGSDTWYVLCELQSELLIYRGAPQEAMLVGRVSVGSRSGNAPAALRLSPDRKYIAASVRGENVISLFAIALNGMLVRMTEVSCMGDWPRDIQFTPDGKYLVCANQKSGTVTAFAVNNGRLDYVSSVNVPAPACVLFTNIQED